MVLDRSLVPLKFRMSVHFCSTGMLRAGMPPQRMESLIEMVGGKYMYEVGSTLCRERVRNDGQDSEREEPLVPVFCHSVSTVQKHW